MTIPSGSQHEPFSAERDSRPVVRLPRPGLPGAAIAIVAALLAVLLFTVLDARRRHGARRTDTVATSAFPAPPPLSLPPTAEPQSMMPQIVTESMPVPRYRVPEPQVTIVPSPPSLAAAPDQPAIAGPPVSNSKISEPALVLDTGAGDGSAAGSIGSAAGQAGTGGAQAAVEDIPVRTTIIGNRTTIMPVGTIIPAVLETPIDSARPGLVRAVVSEDARGFDGRRVLVPRGSRLIGEYQSDVRSGQNRVLVTWTRLIRPDGVAIRIGSPAADALGGSGIPGHVNSFFFQRFASAVLQSALTVGVNLASRPGSGSVIVGLPTNGAGTIGQDLLPPNDLKPKIKVRQGAVLDVFVARDLDFSGAPHRPQDDAN